VRDELSVGKGDLAIDKKGQQLLPIELKQALLEKQMPDYRKESSLSRGKFSLRLNLTLTPTKVQSKIALMAKDYRLKVSKTTVPRTQAAIVKILKRIQIKMDLFVAMVLPPFSFIDDI
jgi:hypothetical protein